MHYCKLLGPLPVVYTPELSPLPTGPQPLSGVNQPPAGVENNDPSKDADNSMLIILL